jgi:hypothetical protein
LTNYVVAFRGNSNVGHAEPSEKSKEKIWEGANLERSGKSANVQHGVLRGWSVPSSGWAKINLDAGLCQDTGQAGCGAVVRNHHGEILLSA